MSGSAVLFSVSLATGCWSLYVGINLYSDAWEPHCMQGGVALEYISTRIAHCLDKRKADVWSLVYCLEVQIFLLLTMWRRLFASYHFVTNMRECAISCGVWFVVSFAMVVDFRNDRDELTSEFLFFPQIPESSLHSYAAVNAMLSLTVLHALLCSSLFALSTYERRIAKEQSNAGAASFKAVSVIDFDFHRHQLEEEAVKSAERVTKWSVFKRFVYDYAALDWIYLACVVVFFFTWATASNSDNEVVYETSVHSEWLVLLLGAMMQAYALWQSERPLSWLQEAPANIVASAMENVRNCKTSWRVLMTSFSYVVALLYTLIIFGMAPLDYDGTHPNGARSSSMLLWTVVTAYGYAALLLLS